MGSVKDLEHLKSLTADYFADRKHEDLLDAWNHLQHTPGKTRIFTFATKRCPELIARYLESTYPSNISLIDGKPQFVPRPQPPYYAYIKHDNDTPGNVDPSDPESGIHYHFYLEYSNARSFASVATELKIPVTMLQGIKVNKRAILQYLTHENDPSKFHYSPDDIHANFDVVQARESEQFDVKELWSDVWAVREGNMTRHEFLDKYSMHCATLSFAQNVRLASDIYKESVTERGLNMK